MNTKQVGALIEASGKMGSALAKQYQKETTESFFTLRKYIRVSAECDHHIARAFVAVGRFELA